MPDNTKLYRIEKSNDEILKTILTNIIKMLTNRGLLDENKLSDNIKNIVNNISKDMSINIKLIDNTSFGIKINLQKITGINKSPDINNFLLQNKDIPKLIVVEEISKKASQHIYLRYPKSEIFLKDELMINLVDNPIVPKHIVLNKNEKLEFFNSYRLKKENLPEILSGDPVAKYYNMKPGDVCKIIRDSEKSGFAVAYRYVKKGSIK